MNREERESRGVESSESTRFAECASDDDSFPRVLVVSNNCFSKSGCNGRTLANFFLGWPVSRLAQFYIKDEIPDVAICEQYFRVTDAEALRSVAGRWRRVGGVVSPVRDGVEAPNGRAFQVRVQKSPLSALVRDAVWRIGAWKERGFGDWVTEFNPELIVLQAGDSAFMYRIALEVANQFAIPLVIYNSEDYYFRTINYMSSTDGDWFSDVFFRMFLRGLRVQTEKAVEAAAISIYNSDTLREIYNRQFGTPAITCMTVTELTPMSGRRSGEQPVVSYLGNLGYGRHKSLIEVGEALQAIDPNLHLDVYGRLLNEEMSEDINGTAGIRFKGFVPYEEVLEVMASSDILVHAESFSPRYRELVRHAFSTKIADTLASGTCFMVYAPKDIASTEYLSVEGAALVAGSRSELLDGLVRVLHDEALRREYSQCGAQTAERNHSYTGSVARFQQTLREVALDS